MADILPGDIGLATFNDVGDVANLHTDAKEIVAAINEVLANAGEKYTQRFVLGENNAIAGNRNLVFGNNNYIIGSDNVVIGDNHVIIGSYQEIYNPQEYLTFSELDFEKRQVHLYYIDAQTFPLKVGSYFAFSITSTWANEDHSDRIDISTEMIVAQVLVVELENSYFTLDRFPAITETPPDEVYTVLEYRWIGSYYILEPDFKVDGKNTIRLPGIVNSGFSANGAVAEGQSSSGLNAGKSTGQFSFSANKGSAQAMYSAALNFGNASGLYALAYNNGYAYAAYSAAGGYLCRACGRAVKCVALNTTAKTLTAAEGESVSNLIGTKILVRYKTVSQTVYVKTATVVNVVNQVIYTEGIYFAVSDQLLSDGYIFCIEDAGGYNLTTGYQCIAGANYSAALGNYTVTSHEGSVIIGKYGVSPESYSFSLANGTSQANQGLAVKMLQTGDICADGTLSSPCADYSEMFEWQDGNPNAEDRAGYFVKLVGDKIEKADDFDEPLGIVSATPALIGDSGELHWQGKYVTDDFGRIQYYDVLIPEQTDEDGNLLVEEHYERQPVINPGWDSTQEYVPRLKRPEWAAVGVIGKLVVYDDGTLQSGDLCRPGVGGRAVKSISNGYRVLKRISEDKVLIWFRG